jgi:enoyl-CoA hydratase
MNRVIDSTSQPVLVEHADSFVHIILNRPEVINSLTLDMIRIMAGVLDEARNNDAVRLIIISGAGERGFCAGGDIKLMARAVTENNFEPAMAFLEEENDLDLVIHRYPKPVVVFANGITMGGGLGISSGADITIASETTRMAMPETRIGFFPDVGSTGWLFLKCRKKGYPEFLGLTGYDMMGAECVRIGLANCLIPASRLADAIEIIKHHAATLPAGRRSAAARLQEHLNPLEEKDIPANPEMDQWVEGLQHTQRSLRRGLQKALRTFAERRICHTQVSATRRGQGPG